MESCLGVRNMNMEAFKEAVKEPLRLLVLAIIPFGIVYFTELEASWGAIIVILLRFIDKYLHEAAKEIPVRDRNEGIFGVKGLVGF